MIRKWFLRQKLRSMGICPDCGERMASGGKTHVTYYCKPCLARGYVQLELRGKALFEELKGLK